MDIISAIKSGKRFRRKLSSDSEFNSRWYKAEGQVWNSFDILSDDWEIEEEKITISKSDFDDIWRDWLMADNRIPTAAVLWDLLKAKDSK